MSKELSNMVTEYMNNAESIIDSLEKEAASYKKALDETQKAPLIQKEAAIEAAAALIGRGLMSADNLAQNIDRLCADPLGVIMQMTKTAAQEPVPSMGSGCNKLSKTLPSTESRSNADKALLSKLNLL